MLDLLDPIASLIAGSRPPGRTRTWREELTWALATLIFPMVDLVAILMVGALQGETAAFVVLPLGLAAATYVVGVLLGATRVASITSAIVCAVFCAGASVLALFLSVFRMF